MRDFLLSEALKRLTTEAATRLSTLVAEGEEIPFDVASEADDSGVPASAPTARRLMHSLSS